MCPHTGPSWRSYGVTDGEQQLPGPAEHADRAPRPLQSTSIRAPVGGCPPPASLQVLVQPAGRFGDRPGQRRVDGERLGHVIHVQAVLHGERDRVDQLRARGATTTPPITVPEPLRAMIFTKPSLTFIIFARALVARSSLRMSPWYLPSLTCASLTPTVAISGLVKMLEETSCVFSGRTPSPIRWAMAMRPCIAATEARAK